MPFVEILGTKYYEGDIPPKWVLDKMKKDHYWEYVDDNLKYDETRRVYMIALDEHRIWVDAGSCRISNIKRTMYGRASLAP